jgi:F-type H+-transporting ATPase subunit epsilon
MVVEIITPEMEVFKGEADAIQFPGLDGSFQVLNNHAPIISALSAGKVKVDLVSAFEVEEGKLNPLIEYSGSDKKTILVSIKGGVVELMNNKAIVLAE